MRLILVNRFFYPDESATSLMLSDLVKGLAETGHERIVITGRSAYTPESSAADEDMAEVKIIRLPTFPLANDWLVGRALNFVAFYVGLFVIGSLSCRRGDVIICLTDPPLSNVVVRAIAVLRSARVINWVQDIYPETATRLGFGSEQSLFVRMLTELRNRAWIAADANVCIGDRMRSKLASHGVARERLFVIQNWADDEALQPLAPSDNKLRAAWGIGDEEVVVGYSGNLGRAHDAKTMLDAAQLLGSVPRNRPRFLFIGGGAKHGLVQALIASPEESKVKVDKHGYQARRELRESLSVSDIHWLSLEPELEDLIVPSKFYGAVAVGRPVVFIGDTDGEIARLIAEAKCGRSFAPGDSEAVASYLLQLSSDKALREELGSNARRYCDEHLTRRARVREWLDLIARFK